MCPFSSTKILDTEAVIHPVVPTDKKVDPHLVAEEAACFIFFFLFGDKSMGLRDIPCRDTNAPPKIRVVVGGVSEQLERGGERRRENIFVFGLVGELY